MSNQFKARGMRVLGRVLDMFKSAVKAEDLTPPPLPPDGNARLKFREMFKPPGRMLSWAAGFLLSEYTSLG